MATNNAYFQAMAIESSMTEKKNALKKAFGVWSRSRTATLDVWQFAVKGNAEKPMVYLQNMAFQCGLWPSTLKKGETVGMGYSTVLRDISLCRKKGVQSEWHSFEMFGQFLSAVYKAGQIEAKRLKDEEEGKAFLALPAEEQEKATTAAEEAVESTEQVQLAPVVTAADTARFYLSSVLDNEDMAIGDIREMVKRALALLDA